ncbi:hypothetical protein [Aeromonas hydrophila]|uniref:hypothetical protein n=1 Tax=Aeromonas hydrophila TaxID=644 RepID=UPI000A9AB629|nr:hypothetical protein [Aeromonas hydrophila]EJN6956219.1 hypothetical protein [Aeromonas hydrophila]CAD7534350.1 hypothetical protein KBAH04_20510 [Aeromonas hydrophila]HAU4876410.1 hypothetical protein [Aeromonas hydrophila]HAU4921571.1 hypothetical protein [Aeromonas hydrophila]
MFLYDPEQYIEWLGYPSQGEFFHGVFSSPLLNKKKLHVPCAKTLKKLFSLNEPVKVTPQAEKFFHRLKECLVSLGVEPEYLEPSSEPILRVQFSARVKWPALFNALQVNGYYPQACIQANHLLGRLLELLDSLDGLEGQERIQKIIDNDWILSSLTELGVGSVVNDCDVSIELEDNETLAKILHYLNIYMFIKVFAAFDADFNSKVSMENKKSLFLKLMPTSPLEDWIPHKSGIFEPLLQAFESKRVGYQAFAKYANCNEDSIKTNLRQFYANERNLKFKTVQKWFFGAFEELSQKKDLDEAEVLNYCEPAWCVADILSGWIKVTHSSEFNNVQVTCFSHYQRFYNEAIGSREP